MPRQRPVLAFSFFIANLSHFSLSDLSFLSPNLQLAHFTYLPMCLVRDAQTKWLTDSVCDHEWRTYLWDSESSHTHITKPVQFTAGRCTYLSPPVCTFPFIAVFVIPFRFCLSFYVSLTVLLFLSLTVPHGMCWEAFIPHISSLKPLHLPLPLIKPQMTHAVFLNRVT